MKFPSAWFRLLSAGLIFFFSATGISAQPKLHLIPTPEQLTRNAGQFTFSKSTSLLLESAKNEETVFAASELVLEMEIQLGNKPVFTTRPAPNQVVFCLLGRDNKNSKILLNHHISIPDNLGEEGYLLTVKPTGIYLAAATEAGLFYGVQTLKLLIRANRQDNTIPSVSITDKPALRYRGWMDDISRGPIPTVEFLKKEIRTMAEFKQNFFNLYTENVFRSVRYPDMSPADGITPGEIKEVADYAAKYHIELMGNFQSFGHQGKLLANPFYAYLGDNSDILNPADENTYRFLSDIYAEMIPVYKSSFFNINCDETFGLGECKSKKLADSLGMSGVYAYHINRLDKLIKPYGKRLLMWGDIAVNNPDIISKLPKDLIILSWGYHAAESFEPAILPFVKTGFNFMVAPGVGCWGELWPALSNAVINISNYTRDGARLGAIGMMNTAWDDNGHNLFEYNWHGLTWGAECSWSPAKEISGEKARIEREQKLNVFNSDFDALFFETKGIIHLYFQIDSLRFHKAKGLLSEGNFWEDILNFYPSNTSSETESDNQEAIADATHLLHDLEMLRKECKRNKENLNYAELALKRFSFAAHRNIARAQLYEVTRAENPEIQAVSRVKTTLQNLVEELHSIKNTYIGLWNKENRSWWLDKNMNDYNKMADRILNLDKQIYIEPSEQVVDGKRQVKLRTLFNDQTIVYTTDGSYPVAQSKVYTTPLLVDSKLMVKASTLYKGKPYRTAEKMIYMHKGVGNLLRLNSTYSKYNPAYAAGGEMGLLDGIKGSDNFADGRWQGFQGQDLDVELDFKKTITVNAVHIDFMQNTYSWVVLPSELDIYTSPDGKAYTLVKTVQNPVSPQKEGQFIYTMSANFDNLNTQFMKIVAKSSGVLPEWHHAAGNPSFIFADEIEIE